MTIHRRQTATPGPADRYVREGFPGQRLHVLPRPLVARARERAPMSRLLVTDAGHFPHAARHGRIRRRGAAETIVMICTAGAGHCNLEDRRYEIRGGEALIIPAGRPHRYFADIASPWSIWWLHVVGSDVADLVDAIGLDADRPVVRISDLDRVVDLMTVVCDALDRDETWASLAAAAGAGWHLLALLAGERQRLAAGGAQPLGEVQDHLRDHLDHPVRIAELAAMAGLSVSHFSARFRASTGYSALEYVKRLRMARARQLLITSDRSVADIAASVGYRDPFYFSRQFRDVNGVSPSRFRERHIADASADPA